MKKLKQEEVASVEKTPLIEEKQRVDLEERIRHFTKDLELIREKYKIDLGSQLSITVNGIVPQFVFIDIKDNPENKTENKF